MDYARAMSILCPPPIPWTCNDAYDSIQRLDGGAVPSDADLQAAFAACVAPRSWSTPDFWAKFTQAEKVAIATSTDPNVKIIVITFSLHPTVESNNQSLLDGLNYLVSTAILTADRMAVILA